MIKMDGKEITSLVLNGSDGTRVRKTLVETDVIPTPTETKNITENGTYDVKNCVSAVVNVPQEGGEEPYPERIAISDDEDVIYFVYDKKATPYAWCGIGGGASNGGYLNIDIGHVENGQFVTDVENHHIWRTVTRMLDDIPHRYIVVRIKAEVETNTIASLSRVVSPAINGGTFIEESQPVVEVYGNLLAVSYVIGIKFLTLRTFDVTSHVTGNVSIRQAIYGTSSVINYRIAYPNAQITDILQFETGMNLLQKVDLSGITLADTCVTSSLDGYWDQVTDFYPPVFMNDTKLSIAKCLSHESLVRVVNALATVSGKTLTLGATNLAKLSDAEKAIATGKGWTLE